VLLLVLGLVEPLLGAVEAVQLIPALREQLGSLHDVTASPSARRMLEPGEPEIVLDRLAVAWPLSEPVFRGASARVARGDWLVVEGPSGSGKSTLIAAMLGYLPAASGSISVRGSGIAWAPQEAHIFDSTVRGNLLLARAVTDSELLAALAMVGLSADLDARVGSEGSRLSGGERQRLAVARALLTDADVVLLDEPTAHLDASAADDLMRDLRFALSDRVVVLVTHHADEVLDGDARLHLGASTLREPTLVA
jgi:ATP-binding cassette, subfamily C, bacterial CydCD